jgi:molybdate-binding protein
LVRVAAWEEGLAVRPSLKATSVGELARGRAHWVGREEGSGARLCQDEALGTRPAPKRTAPDHRTVAAAIKCGWADVGPCVRLATEEAGLTFLKMHEKNYDLCFRRETAGDPRMAALLATLRSREYRSKLSELPGYRTDHTGEVVS